MEVCEIPTAELAKMAAPYNPRTISDHDLAALRRSLKFFGTVEPIVVNQRSGNIVGGHQRVRAAEAEKIESLPVVYVDLDDPSEKQLNVALNKIAGEFDVPALSELLAGLEAGGADLELTGFSQAELEELFRGQDEPRNGLTDPDEVPDVPEEPATKPGDLILLDKHRLLCGDSTNEPMVRRVMDGQLGDCTWTDPPYGVSYTGKTGEALTIENDRPEGLVELLIGAFARADQVLKPGAPIYIAHPAGRQSVTFGRCFLDQGWRLHQTLVWVKDTIVLGHSDYHYRHEPILFGYKPGDGRCGRGGSHWYGDNAQASVLEVPRPKASREHPTSKPVELVTLCLRNSTKRKDTVYEPFMGSGSTLIACEQMRRSCYGLEVDPRYCDVIVQRWQEFTGQKAQGWRGNG